MKQNEGWSLVLAKLQDLFSKPEKPEKNIQKSLRLATAALLVEVARADFERDSKEETALAIQIKTILDISGSEVAEIISSASNQVEKATSLYEFTNLINEQCSASQKFTLLQSMWRIAYADGNIDRYEEHLIRRVAELIYLSHSDYIRAKLSASKYES